MPDPYPDAADGVAEAGLRSHMRRSFWREGHWPGSRCVAERQAYGVPHRLQRSLRHVRACAAKVSHAQGGARLNSDRSRRSQQVGRAAYASAAAVEDMGVDHGGLEVAVTEQLLNGADVVAVGEQVGGEAVAEAMERGVLGDVGSANGRLEGPLDGTLVQVVPAVVAGLPSGEPAGGREDVLPAPLGGGGACARAPSPPAGGTAGGCRSFG